VYVPLPDDPSRPPSQSFFAAVPTNATLREMKAFLKHEFISGLEGWCRRVYFLASLLFAWDLLSFY
jgi:hypothetical protein